MGKVEKICQKLRKYRNFAKSFESMIKCYTSRESWESVPKVEKCTRSWERVLNTDKVFESVSKLLKVWGKPICLEIFVVDYANWFCTFYQWVDKIWAHLGQNLCVFYLMTKKQRKYEKALLE